MTWRILITCPPMLKTLDNCRERFAAEGWQVVAPEVIQQLSETELCNIISEFDGVIAGDDPFTRNVLSTGYKGRLRALAKWGIGLDAIDLDAAKELGILTSNTPDVFGEEVADVAVCYTILLARQLHRIDSAVRQGDWLKIRGVSLKGRTAGIIGVGSIGKALAKRLQSMGMPLLGYDIMPLPNDFCAETGLRQVDLPYLLRHADVILLACVLTANNRYLLDEEAFELMNRGVFIVNVARGPLIKESALLAALDRGQVAGAALDVFENEPLTTSNSLCNYSQVILGSHNSSNTKEAVLRVNQLAIDNLSRDLKKIAAKQL